MIEITDPTLFSFTMGVLPIASKILSKNWVSLEVLSLIPVACLVKTYLYHIKTFV